MKTDIEARTLCDILKVPCITVSQEIYEKIIVRINEERQKVENDTNASEAKKFQLIDESMRAQSSLMNILTFHDSDHNLDFINELCTNINV